VPGALQTSYIHRPQLPILISLTSARHFSRNQSHSSWFRHGTSCSREISVSTPVRISYQMKLHKPVPQRFAVIPHVASANSEALVAPRFLFPPQRQPRRSRLTLSPMRGSISKFSCGMWLPISVEYAESATVTRGCEDAYVVRVPSSSYYEMNPLNTRCAAACIAPSSACVAANIRFLRRFRDPARKERW
jgi:hypothetical protein